MKTTMTITVFLTGPALLSNKNEKGQRAIQRLSQMKDLMEQQVRLARWLFFSFPYWTGGGGAVKKIPFYACMCMYVFDGGNGDDESIKRSDSLGRIGK